MISQGLKIRQRERKLGSTSEETAVLLGKKDVYRTKMFNVIQGSRGVTITGCMGVPGTDNEL